MTPRAEHTARLIEACRKQGLSIQTAAPLTPAELDKAANAKFACNRRWEKAKAATGYNRYVLSQREAKGIPSRQECRAIHLCIDCGQPAKVLAHGFALKCAGCLDIAKAKRVAKGENQTP